MIVAYNRKAIIAAGVTFCLSLTGCSSAPLRLYTLQGPATSGMPVTGPVMSSAPVIEVRRVALPNYLDSQDIMVRDGSVLRRSPNGRWAERLSDGITDMVTARIGAARPDLVVTEQSLARPASAHLVVTLSRLDIAQSAPSAMEASWAFVPTNENEPENVERATFTSNDAAGSDEQNVAIINSLVSQLSDRIASSLPR